MKIDVVYSPLPQVSREWVLELAGDACVGTALQQSGLFLEFPELATQKISLGIWGKHASREDRLQDLDRVEIYRALRVDPKIARRERFDRQGMKSAGLFSKKRTGAKAGY